MTQNYQKNRLSPVIADLQARLSQAYDVIDSQQEYINQLETELSYYQSVNEHDINEHHINEHHIDDYSYTNFSTEDFTYTVTPVVTPVTVKPKIRKRVSNRKKKSGKLSRLKFARIIALIVFFNALMALLVIWRNHHNSSQTPSQTSSTLTETIAANKELKPSPSPTVSSENKPPAISFPNIFSWGSPGNFQLDYNIKSAPILQKSEKLQAIVDGILADIKANKLPPESLSITLIDVKTATYAEFQQDIQRFPASVAKMFWMVYFYAHVNRGMINEANLFDSVSSMIKKSDNNSASFVLDVLTETQSKKSLADKEFEDWLQKRNKVNSFFQQADYQDININQKLFPINYLGILEPQGTDLKMRGNPSNPIRNHITTQQAGRLLYEIFSGQAVSPAYSQKMSSLLTIDVATRVDKKEGRGEAGFNQIRGYFSESLPLSVNIAGKAGGTSSSRQEAAYITTPDGRAAYILVVFAEDQRYADNWKIFPKISQRVYNSLTQ
ncbi:MAG: class A beta-lactamase-related serine hydrolase [Scytonematopsis contorta HA4267-MV1]|nr:class A beta-lactamase-related serine hydrolase [Scytonematopsis contorta HA4267-MV1]